MFNLFHRVRWAMYATGFFLLGLPAHAWAAEGNKPARDPDTLLKAFDNVEAAAKVLGEKLTQLNEKYGPQTTELALNVARMDAIRNLATGLAFWLAAFVFYALAKYLLGKNAPAWDGGEVFVGVGGAIVGLILTFMGATYVLDVWAWAGVFDPKLYLAYKFLLEAH